MAAITGALTLLCNIVIAWNTVKFQEAMNTGVSDRERDQIPHIAPSAHAHINMRGRFIFDLSIGFTDILRNLRCGY